MIQFVPLVLKYWKLAAGAAIVIGAGIVGYNYSENKWEAKYAKLQEEAALVRLENQKLATKSEQVTIQEVTRYVDRIKVVEKQAQEIIKEVPIYVTEYADSICTLTDGTVWLHDKAASTPGTTEIPQSPANPDGTTTEIRISDYSTKVIENYSVCHKNSEQLIALQNWIKQQQLLYNKE
jgi:hypothetical protein